MYSMFSFVKAFCENLAPELIFNWDATQFIMSDDLDTKGLYISTEKAHDEALTSEGTGTVGFAVKLYHLHNAAGYSAMPVFVVADESMEEEDFKCFLVNGLGNCTSMDSKGWVCFTNMLLEFQHILSKKR